MNVINGSKSFYRYMKRDSIVLAYFYVDDLAVIAPSGHHWYNKKFGFMFDICPRL